MQHIIGKQVIDLRIRNKKDAYRLQQLTSEQYHRNVIAVLQKAFDMVSRKGETISIDRLEIDLGIITEKEIERGAWESLILKIFNEQFDRLKKGPSSGKILRSQPTAISSAERWLIYIQWGYLPWNATRVDDSWHGEVLHMLATDFTLITKLRVLISKNVQVIRRIIFQHKEDFLVALAESLTAQSQKSLPGIIDEVVQLILFFKEKAGDQFQNSGEYEHQQLLWEQVLVYAAAQREKKSVEALITHLLDMNAAMINYPFRIPARFFSTTKITAQVLKRWKENIAKKEKQDGDQAREEARQKKQTQPGHEDDLPTDLQVADIRRKILKPSANDDRRDTRSDRSPDQAIYPDKLDEDIFVQYAGIVLLHPFLRTFFKNLGILEGDKFISNDHHQKALYLLYYLATGLVDPAEHELVSSKIICNYPLHMPVFGKLKLSNEEINEADVLLTEVIRQWEILRDSSPDALREGFLQRGGKFFSKNDLVYLQVEPGSIDVLLDYLPWNLSVVQLPWMNRMLRVEWR